MSKYCDMRLSTWSTSKKCAKFCCATPPICHQSALCFRELCPPFDSYSRRGAPFQIPHLLKYEISQKCSMYSQMKELKHWPIWYSCHRQPSLDHDRGAPVIHRSSRADRQPNIAPDNLWGWLVISKPAAVLSHPGIRCALALLRQQQPVVDWPRCRPETRSSIKYRSNSFLRFGFQSPTSITILKATTFICVSFRQKKLHINVGFLSNVHGILLLILV